MRWRHTWRRCRGDDHAGAVDQAAQRFCFASGLQPLVALAVLYSRGWYRISKTLPNLIPVWRLAAFAGGLIALWVALGSPLAELDEQLLTAHMTQHLLLMTMAAPLILLGAPSITLLHALPRRFVHYMLGPLIRWRPVHYLGRICTHPAF